jgi:hypothetical protein
MATLSAVGSLSERLEALANEYDLVLAKTADDWKESPTAWQQTTTPVT